MPMLSMGPTGGIVPPNWFPPHAMHNPVNVLAYYANTVGVISGLSADYFFNMFNPNTINLSGRWNLTHDYMTGLSQNLLPPASHPGNYANFRSLVSFSAAAPFHAPRGLYHAFPQSGGHPWNQEHATDHLSSELQDLARRFTAPFRR